MDERTAPQSITSPRRRALLRALALLALPGKTLGAAATPPDLRILTRDNSEATQQALAVLRRHFPQARSSSNIDALAARPSGVFVAIGPAALQVALAANLPRPLVCLFTSNEAYTRLVSQFAHGRGLALTTAIFAEAAPTDQMSLIRHLYGRQVLVGVLLSPGSTHLESELTSAAREADVELKVQMVGPDETAPRALSRLSGIKVLLAIPDRALYTSETLRAILETGYRRNFATVGFSPSVVSAGALAAAYASIDDVVVQLRQWVQPLAAGHVPKPQYPLYWRVAINDRVASSLNVPIDPTVRTLGNRPERTD